MGSPATGEACLGQQRAIDAIRFGIDMPQDGYNIFVLGPLGSDRHVLVEHLVNERAQDKGAPYDWCYVNNFADSERPRSLRFPNGRGRRFRDGMQQLIEEIRLAIPAAFEGDDYRNQLQAIETETQAKVDEQWQSLQELAEKDDVAVLQTPTGYVLAPVVDGKVIGDKEFAKLPEDRQQTIQEAIQRLGKELQARVETMPKIRKEHRERVRALDQEVIAHAVSLQLADLKQQYGDLPRVSAYLDDVQANIIENAQDFRQPETPSLPFLSRDSFRLFNQYEVNLVVDNGEATSAPVIYEPSPTHPNVIGRIEHRAEMGTLVTDFSMVRAGALLQANGGYLVLDVVSTTTLKPEPIPLDIKVILIGERWLYYLLSHYDAEFGSLFKVAADIDDDLLRDDGNVQEYARVITRQADRQSLLPLSTAAIQRVIEERARRAGDSERLSTHIRSLDDLLAQASHWAGQRGADHIDVEDVARAIEERNRRLGRLQSRTIDAIRRNTLLIDTSGERVGQVNGLSVIDLGEFRYGHPVRITATTRIGTGNVIDIEREVELGGAIHSKGMMILSSALASRYAPDMPLSLHGSVVFEQSYSGVEGDSASVAELCALLSSLSQLPIRQNLAVTGSVNQHGRVQAIGAANEKIEGFFDICRERGLDGNHGVIIPRDNVKHLMLREDVVEAVRRGDFSVFAVERIDQAIGILTGVDAGERGADGAFPENTVNQLVEHQLITYAELRRGFAGQEPEADAR
jgi:predicted ATP-dependent protease